MKMKCLSTFLSESKNTHLEHIEDSIFMSSDEVKDSIRFLTSLRNMLGGHSSKGIGLTVKWDGAPAIICGKDPENGKFFVGTKSVFNKTPKINYTNADINKNHSGGLADKLKIALKHLSKLEITGVLQGDLMFTEGDFVSKEIDGEQFITFTPNTITYAVSENSLLSSKLKRAKMGIVFHTEYKGRTIQTMRASFGPKLRLKKSNDVWYDDSSFKDFSGVNLSSSDINKFDASLTNATSLIKRVGRFLDSIEPNVQSLLKIYINSKVRVGTLEVSHNDFVKYVNGVYEGKIDKLGSDAGKSRKKKELDSIVSTLNSQSSKYDDMFDLFGELLVLKNIIVSQLNKIKGKMKTFVKTDSGYKITAPEGFVSIDQKSDKAFKLVDRLEFSKNNFTVAKNWD